MSEADRKEPCPACGYEYYRGELVQCPRCDEWKCSFCDEGDDKPCLSCANEVTPWP
jgi:hypothetical protein